MDSSTTEAEDVPHFGKMVQPALTMLIEHDLGHLDIRSNVSGLQVRLSSVAKLAPSEEDKFDEIQTRLTTCKLNASRVHRPWIYRGSNFRLVLSLRLGGVLDALEEQLLITTLSSQLRSAKLWEQLYLSPTSIETACETTGHHQLTIYLYQSDTGVDQVKRKLHKLGTDVPFHDIKPPTRVCSAALEAIHMDISVERSSRQKRRRIRQRDSISTLSNAADVDKIMTDIDLETVDEPVLDSYDDNLFEVDVTTAMEAACDASEVLLDSECEDCANEDVEMLFEFDEGTSSSSLNSIPSSSSRLESTWGMSDPGVENQNACIYAILELVDTAIRLALTRSPKRLAKGISVIRNDSFERLADFAPSVWSPAYLPAVATRAVFLPTIGHAIDSVCFKHKVSGGPKCKGTDLIRRASHSCHNINTSNHADVHVPAPASQDELSVLLWQRLQCAMYDDKAARRLENLSVKVNGATEDLEVEDELLDFSLEIRQGSLPYNILDACNGLAEDSYNEESGLEDDLLDGDSSPEEDLLDEGIGPEEDSFDEGSDLEGDWFDYTEADSRSYGYEGSFRQAESRDTLFCGLKMKVADLGGVQAS